MIGIICIYLIGKYFYRLAIAYNKNAFLSVILGLVCFYLGSVIFGGVIYYLWFGHYMFSGSDILFSIPHLGILKMPFGIALACLIHYLLEVIWKKTKVHIGEEINDIGKE
ncbi:hypothetical protein ACKGJY_09235 [Hyunsoonleella sp. 2307UL5-6]|uniref:hypothetical protein n=1 Tax=Hyunsoonleella sp. 2307UL5-6 TaxID=3384768 RepID=UPI0039BD6896